MRPPRPREVRRAALVALVGSIATSTLLIADAAPQVALAAAIATAAYAGPRLPPSTRKPARGWIVANLAGAITAGAAVRAFALGEAPFWIDPVEATNGWIGLELVARFSAEGYRALLGAWDAGNATAFPYVLGIAQFVGGHSLEALRFPGAVIGTLTIPALYVAGREVAGARGGLVAAWLCALLPTHVELSRTADRAVLLPLVVALTLAAAYRALAHPDTRRGLVHAALAGAAAGFGYHAGALARTLLPAAALGLALARWREGRARRGVAEAALCLACGVAIAWPVLVEAARDPAVWLAARATDTMEDSGAIGAVRAALLDAPRQLVRGLPWPSASAALVAFALVGTVALARLPRTGWLPILVVVAALVLHAALARPYDSAPRRWAGAMVPALIACGLAVERTLMVAAVVRAGGLAGAVGLLAWLAASAPEAWRSMQAPEGGPSCAALQLAFAECAASSRSRAVWLHPEIADIDHPVARWYLSRPGIARLATTWPLPDGAAGALVAYREDRWLELRRLRVAKPTPHPLVRPDGERVGELWFSEIPVDRLRSLRLGEDALARGMTRLPGGAPGSSAAGARGWLLVDRPGTYRFAVPPGAELDVGRVAGDGPRVLAGGLVAFRYRPGHEVGTIRWMPPGAPDWAPLPMGRLWTNAVRVLGRAPFVKPATLGLVPGRCERVVAADAPEGHAATALALVPEGALVASHGPTPLGLARVDGTVAPFPLRGADGGPFGLPVDTGGHEPRTLAVAATARSIYMLDSRRAELYAFESDGNWRARVAHGLARPEGLAVLVAGDGGERLVVADRATRAIYAIDPATGAHEVLFADADTAAVAVVDATVAWLDLARTELVIAAHGIFQRAKLVRVDARMRLSGSATGFLVTDPTLRTVLLFDPNGRLLAPANDVHPCARLIDRLGEAPIAAALEEPSGRFAVLGATRLAWAQLEPDPDRGLGMTLEAKDARGALNLEPDGLGQLVATDAGRPGAWCTWQFEATRAGAHEVWLRCASTKARPVSVSVDGVRCGTGAQATGGATCYDERWLRLGDVELALGPHELRLEAEGAFPTLSRVRLVLRR